MYRVLSACVGEDGEGFWMGGPEIDPSKGIGRREWERRGYDDSCQGDKRFLGSLLDDMFHQRDVARPLLRWSNAQTEKQRQADSQAGLLAHDLRLVCCWSPPGPLAAGASGLSVLQVVSTSSRRDAGQRSGCLCRQPR